MSHNERLDFRINPYLKEKLTTAARNTNRSITEYVMDAIEEQIKRDGENDNVMDFGDFEQLKLKLNLPKGENREVL